MPFLILFFGLPLAELLVLLEVGEVLGGWETVGLCVMTAFVGGTLAKHQGVGLIHRMRHSLNQGEVPAVEMMDSVMIVVAGLLLMTPGFLTDVVGLLLLTPPVRAFLRPAILRGVLRRVRAGQPGQGFQGAGPGAEWRAADDEVSGAPEFLPPGTVSGPPLRKTPPEIIVD